MLTSDSLQFLYELSQNNNRDWFEKNKKHYEKTLKKPFEQAVSAIIEGLRTFEPELAPHIRRDIGHKGGIVALLRVIQRSP